MSTILDSRQSEHRAILENTGTAANATVKTILEAIDAHFGQLKITPDSPISQRVVIPGSDVLKDLGFKLSLASENTLISFEGAEIDFETGTIYESDGTTVVSTFTPFVLTANQYFYYSITANIDPVLNADNTANLLLTVTPAVSANTVLASAPKALFISGLPLGQVYVQKNGANTAILNIDWANIIQIAAGSGGGGGSTAEGVRAYKVDAIPRTATDTLIVDLDVTSEFTFLKIRVEVTQVFDGSPTLEVGIPSDHDFLFTNADIDLTSLGIYEISVSNELASPEEIRCYITSGGTTGIVNVTVLGFGE